MAYGIQKREDAAAIAALQKKTAAMVADHIKRNRAAILATLPAGFNLDRMTRTVINAISTSPLLAKCSVPSLFLSVVRAFSVGLEPNGALSEGYLIPFWDSKKGGYEAQFMPSYRGLQNLSRRSGKIADIYAKTVCENDTFEVEEGTERRIVHKPDYTKDRGKAVCYYAVFHLKDGGVDFEVMSRGEIEKVRASSKSADKGPWVDWAEEMAKKTVMKRLLKRAPMSIELAQAVSMENAAATGDPACNDIIDIDGLEVPTEGVPEVQAALNAEKTAELKKQLESKRQAATAQNQEAENPATFTMMIAQEIERSHAPISPADVMEYAKGKKQSLTLETDYKTLVK